MPSRDSTKRWPLILFATVALVIVFPSVVGHGCLIRHETGLLCPGCGGKRALAHLLQGDWLAATRANLLIFLLLAGMILQLRAGVAGWRGRTQVRGPLQLHRREMAILLWFVLLFTVARNMPALESFRP